MDIMESIMVIMITMENMESNGRPHILPVFSVLVEVREPGSSESAFNLSKSPG